ncbi:MAG: tetratricopeptide repeat protein, partial [Planctomycetes bacterium]|nr:tetratricopeptide repeat protein [Planctomycetota bacterium]
MLTGCVLLQEKAFEVVVVMLRKPKSLLLMLATILAAGCAHSDYGSRNRRNIRWAALDQPKSQKVQRAVEPKILPATYFAAAGLLEQEGDFAKAIVQYRKAIAVNHNFVAAYHRLGVLLGSMGLHDEAIQALSRATLLAPQNVVLRNNYGYAFMVQARWEEAAHQFRRCTELRPQFTRAYINLGMTLTKLSRFDEAFQTFRVVLPEPVAHNNLGIALKDKGELDAAIEHYNAALRIDPEGAGAHNNLGGALRAKGELDAAIEHYNAALRIDPDYADAHNNLGIALQAKGDLDA